MGPEFCKDIKEVAAIAIHDFFQSLETDKVYSVLKTVVDDKELEDPIARRFVLNNPYIVREGIVEKAVLTLRIFEDPKTLDINVICK